MINFLKEVKSELFKVVWPSRKEAFRLTAVVIGFCVITAAFLGAVDLGLLKGFELLLK